MKTKSGANLASRILSNEKLRFVLAGAANTAATLGAYWILLLFFDYRVAYSAAYVLGIIFSYFLNTYFVFRTRAAAGSAAAYPLVYAAQYCAGLGVLWVWVSLLHLPSSLGVLAVALCTLPLTFLLSKVILVRSTPTR